MAVGDESAQSYGWLKKLEKAVASGDEVTYPAPGFDHRYTDTRYCDVSTPDGKTYRAGGEGLGVDVVFNSTSHDDPVTVTVANHTNVEWPAGGSLYVFCPHVLSAGANEWDLKEQIWDLQQRVVVLEGGEPVMATVNRSVGET